MKPICFIVTTPFTANAFLGEHLIKLSRFYAVSLCLNTDLYPISLEIEQSAVKIIHIPLQRKFSPLADLKALFCLIKTFHHFHFDSVHSLTPKAGLLSMCAAFLVRVPIRIHTFTGQVWENKVGVKRILLKFFDWLIAKLATQIFADSPSQVQFLINHKICSKQSISVLGPGSMIGVNIKRFSPNPEVREQLRSQLGISKPTCLFLFVGRLCKDKGIWDVLKAFVHLREKFADIGLLVVGPDEEHVVENAKRIYGDILNSVFWIGQTFEPEKYMATAEVLVLPSYREGFGSVIIEAASCHLPTIAYRINGVIDAVVDGQTGLLVNKGSLEELQTQMQRLLNDHQLRERMGSLAREQACQKFSQEKVTQAWLDFYANLFKTHN